MDGITMETPGGLQDAGEAIFEKAVNGEVSCQVLAGICAKLDEKCRHKNLFQTYNIKGLAYCVLEISPPREVVGSFDSHDSAIKGLEHRPEYYLTDSWSPPWVFVDCKERFAVDGEVFSLWCTEDFSKYCFSRPIVLSGPLPTATEAKQAAKKARPLRRILLPLCQQELEESTGNEDEAEKMKQRKIGTCRFLGALFRQGIVEKATIYKCIDMLLNTRQDIAGGVAFVDPSASKPDDIKWEAVCALLKSAGSHLEPIAQDPILSKYLRLMKMKCSSNLINQVHGIIDLREKGWDTDAHEMEKACNDIAFTVWSKRMRTG